jgi:outer membrane protein assembly factor BamB
MLTNGKLVFVSGGSGAGNNEDGPRILWSAETHTGTIGPEDVKLICNDWIICALSKTGITGFSENGEKSLSFNLRNISSLPALSEDGSLYAGGNDWILYAYQTEDNVDNEKKAGQRSAGGNVRKSYGTADPRLPTLEQYPYLFEENEISQDLKLINRFTRSGDTGEYERLTVAYLMEIATGLREHTLPRSRGGAPISPHYRVEALRLLGYLGSRETIPFLAHICLVDPEPAARAAAANAIGRIGVDPEGIAFRAFTSLIYPPSPTPDDQVLLAIASAIGSICRFSGPPLSETGAKLLVALEGRERSQILQRRAREELSSLK